MTLAPMISTLPIWLLFVLPLAAIGLLVLWTARRGGKKAARRLGTGDMLLDRLKQANGKISAVVTLENNAIQAIALLPEDVGPLEAERALRTAMPEATAQQCQALMLHAWEVQKRPQALAALAGLALGDPANGHAGLNAMVRRALNEGSPSLLGHIASALDRAADQLGDSVQAGELLVALERAAGRIETQAPDIAAHLRKSGESLSLRAFELMRDNLRGQIAAWEEKAGPDALKMAGALAASCLPRFPELAADVHRALSRHEGPELERAHIWFDKAILHHFYDAPGGLNGFDFDAALDRLCAGIMSSDAETSRFAAESAADLLSDYFYGADGYRAALRSALDWALGRHDAMPIYDWLADELDPPQANEPNPSLLEASLEWHRRVDEDIRALADVTATADPAVALAELRGLMPDVPAEMARNALIARWQEKPSPVWLAALAGLALEQIDGVAMDGKMAQTCLYWPLKAGDPALIAAIHAALEARFARLDGWMQTEAGVRDLRQAGRRIAEAAPDVSIRIDLLLARVQARRVPLLQQTILARLTQEEGRDGDQYAFQLAYDLSRLCLPGESTLEGPVRAFMEKRVGAQAWREALLHFENLRANYFAAYGELDDHDLSYFIERLCEGFRDPAAPVALLAAAMAAKLVGRGVLAGEADLARLAEQLRCAETLHDPAPESFPLLWRAIAAKQDFVGLRH